MAKELSGPAAAQVPQRVFKGQIQFADGSGTNIECRAIDHITAMLKVAATLSDHPVPAVAWIMKDETDSSRIIRPFESVTLPKEPGK